VTGAVGAPTPAGDAELPVWRLIDLGRCEPYRTQAFAESVAESVARGDVPNTLLIAQPDRPYISLGFHQSFLEELDPVFLAQRRVPVIRRVEGGGTTWLDPDQWFYQLVYRDGEGGRGGAADLERFLAAPVRAARDMGLPVDLRLPSDLVVEGRKISGNAGGDWADAHLLVGGFLGRADHAAMANLLRLPHPGLGPLLRAQIDRWITSWELETGAIPAWDSVRDHLVEAFRTLRLFRVRSGRPTSAEESRFLSETVPRHQDPEWRELPPVPRPRGPILRRIRIAGPRGMFFVADEGSERVLVAIVDGVKIRAGYVLGCNRRERPQRLASDAPELGELRAALSAIAGFD
jgi:lipoate-protein ligase A